MKKISVVDKSFIMGLFAVIGLISISVIMAGCVERDETFTRVEMANYSKWVENPIRITNGNITRSGYAQGIQGTSIVEIVKEKLTSHENASAISPYVWISREVIGKTVIGKLVQVESKETGIFFKKTNVVLTFEDSEDGKKTTVITANCAKQQIWHKGEIQEITIMYGKVESVKIKNYEI